MINSIENLVITRYSEYEDLIKNSKLLKRSSFGLTNGTGPKKDWNLGDVDLSHCNGMPGNLVTEQSKKKSTKYRLILFIRSFAIEPLCRFDSDGRAHENVISLKPLLSRRINTPHFHQYDKNGMGYAFKTDNLIDNEREIKDNVQMGIQEMCTVYNIYTARKEPPFLIDTLSSPFVPISEEADDLHKDIFFPI